jgi:hypothetical protein
MMAFRTVPYGEGFLYSNIVYPNMNGNLILACMLKPMILQAMDNENTEATKTRERPPLQNF